MSLYHLRLLIQKSIRYAWRRRICRYIPKILFEFSIPVICLLLLCLLRWIYTPSLKSNSLSSSKSSRIHITSSSIISRQESIQVFNYTSVYRCPPSKIPIEIFENKTFYRFKRLCPRSQWILSSSSEQYHPYLYLNISSDTHYLGYSCPYNHRHWCEKLTKDLIEIQHSSSYLCSLYFNFNEFHQFLKAYLSIESLLLRPSIKKHQLSIFTWPCSSYLSDSIYELFPRFTLILIFIFLDGCILFNFNSLFQELISEKHQGISAHLRLLTIPPFYNTLSWFLRYFIPQLILNLFIILILKLSFNGEIYFRYLSIWLIIFTFLFWIIQVLSQAILIGQVFNSLIQASLCSWIIYLISFWLAISTIIQIPMFIHWILSSLLPFYSIKRILIIFIKINMDLGRMKYFTNEIVAIWLAMIIGSVLSWIFSLYFQEIRPGKYGLVRSWLWPLDYFRNKRKQTPTDMNILQTTSDEQTIVRVDNLTKAYGRYKGDRQIVVDHISFTLENSKIYGLIGHNGSGKTTTMEMLCGLLSYDYGQIEIHQKNLFNNFQELQSSIGYCPQHDMLFAYLTVEEQLEFYACVRSKGNNINNFSQIDDLLLMMNMNEYRKRLCYTLSSGMQRKLSILCALVGNVDVIILDEPTSSLDPVSRRRFYSWLREYKLNRTLLISSHLLDEVEEICDEIIILDSGKISAQGSMRDLKRRFSSSGDRIRLDVVPEYIPDEWIIDEDNHYVQVPTRKELIHLLEQLEKDEVKYSLINITLDEIFLKLTSTSESSFQDENLMKSQIDQLFTLQTNNHLWFQQSLAVLIRRCQVFIRRIRLLLFVLILYLTYALAPLYLPSFSPPSDRIRYIISSSPEYLNNLNLKHLDTKFLPVSNSSYEFQQSLSEIPTWSSTYQPRIKLIGIRIPSPDQFECYIPSPVLSNIITSCLPIFSIFSNRSISPLKLITNQERNSPNFILQDNSIFCFSILPPSYHLAILLLSLILIICSALVIQDRISGLHSYSLIHGLNSPLYWCIVFLSDLFLCLLWLLILICTARFVHPSSYNGLFYLLTPLFYIGTLPFLYLISKFFQAPILGSTVIVFLLQLAHFLNTFKIIFEIFRQYEILTKFIQWLLLLIFPNVNVFILIKAILRKKLCPYDNTMLLLSEEEFSSEQYSNKIFIHTLIFFIQFIFYFILLVIIDIWKFISFKRKVSDKINEQDEDDDVKEERCRIETMNDSDRQDQVLILNNLSKYFHRSNHPAVNRLTFAVPPRQCFGLLGFNGSGKTTTFRMLVGELMPTSGSIYKNHQISIGYCPQNDISFSGLTVIQSINYICRVHGLQPSLLNHIILKQFQLEKHAHYLVSHLSGGTRRRLHLGLCLIGSPKLLLLDEPTAKIDPFLRHHIRFILEHRPLNTSIIFSSHSMFECEQLCQRLTILVHGTARCLGSPEHLKNKYGMNYRIRLTLLQPTLELTSLKHIENSNEYLYSNGSLIDLFKILEEYVDKNIIQSNYTVELTSLEQIFLTLQRSSGRKI